ncbi:MAG: GxxExxY protein [Bacteroidetes bacterium]|nr:GxxExxY protein [Bacteroidota bacterium]
MENNLIYKEECYKIVGICMNIHKKLGKGFKEVVYKDAMQIEFNKAGIAYQREKTFNINYDGVILPHKFSADFFVFNAIIIEVKAISIVPTDSFRQTLNYLKAAQVQLGILINFGTDSLTFQRIVCTH